VAWPVFHCALRLRFAASPKLLDDTPPCCFIRVHPGDFPKLVKTVAAWFSFANLGIFELVEVGCRLGKVGAPPGAVLMHCYLYFPGTIELSALLSTARDNPPPPVVCMHHALISAKMVFLWWRACPVFSD
jgi:hypothetical protein